MLDITKNGHFNLEIYNQLFPTSHIHPLKVEYRGWKTIEYYLSNINGEVPDFTNESQQERENMKPQLRIKQMARLYFDDYITRKGVEHFHKYIIIGFDRTNINGVQWLHDAFLKLAKEHPGFTLEDWDEFVQDENGQPQANELLFQLRLELTNLFREYTQTPIKS
jgi:hypothetical protein